MSNSPIILILGAGSNVGESIAKLFASKGYKIARVSRSAKEANNTADQIYVKGDLSDPKSLVSVFSEVKEQLGIPSVVVYNASATHMNDAKNTFSVSLEDFTRDLTINTVSTYAAAQQSTLGFEQLPESASKTFIYTGNLLNTAIMAPLLTLGVGKTASAHIIQSAASVFKDRGIKFYYADERNEDGSPMNNGLNGDAHATHYAKLADNKEQGPWQQTFVKGIGYKQF